VLLNSASGQVLGKAFLTACARTGNEATLVLCSSPAAAAHVAGVSHYGAGKSALQFWAAATATEVEGWARVFSVVPFAVDTPMVRETITLPPGITPVADKLRAAAQTRSQNGGFTGQCLWRLAPPPLRNENLTAAGLTPARLGPVEAEGQYGAGACGTVDCCHERESQTHTWEAPTDGTSCPGDEGATRTQLTPSVPWGPGLRPGPFFGSLGIDVGERRLLV
jgi:NAD(P)-dependent dehydrogenase (short-subunit alcohol dehydrogenase family)